MSDSTLAYNLSLDEKMSQKTISENPNYKHVSNIIGYHRDRRISYLSENNNLSNEANCVDEVTFEVPNINTSIKLDNRNYSKASYTWICYVTSIQQEIFTARVDDLRTSEKTYEEAEFEINDLDDEEIKMLKIGSVFYWSVGYEFRNGTKKKESFIRFKRLPTFNQTQIDSALDLSAELFNDLNWVD